MFTGILAKRFCVMMPYARHPEADWSVFERGHPQRWSRGVKRGKNPSKGDSRKIVGTGLWMSTWLEGTRRRDGVCGSCNHRRLSATFSSIDRIALRRRMALAALPRGAQVSYGCSNARAPARDCKPQEPFVSTYVYTGGGRGNGDRFIPFEYAFSRDDLFFSLSFYLIIYSCVDVGLHRCYCLCLRLTRNILTFTFKWNWQIVSSFEICLNSVRVVF